MCIRVLPLSQKEGRSGQKYYGLETVETTIKALLVDGNESKPQKQGDDLMMILFLSLSISLLLV
jgi:hypothetical protein